MKQNRIRCQRLLAPVLAAFLCVGPFAASARADALLMTNGLPYNDVTITGVKDDQIEFSFRGNPTAKPIAQVAKLTLSDEPAFNAAEEAYAAKEWDKAVEAYEKTLRTTKPWLKDWATQRLLDSANKGGRFDAAVKALVSLAEKSPDAARAVKLNMPAAKSAYLAEAVKEVNAALARKVPDESKEVLLNFLIELQNARNDTQGAADALQRRMQLKAADPNSPEGRRAAALLKLQAAKIALAAKDWDKVIGTVEKEGEVFLEPADQAEALYLLAEARSGKAAGGDAPGVWKDVALAYMRVVANAPASSPQVPAALLKTAAIHEKKLNEKQTALAIYRQIEADYKGQEAAREAAKEIERLKQG